jgi:hypothetical protein
MNVRSISQIASVAALAAMLPVGISTARAVSAPAAPLAGDSVVQPAQFQRVEWTEAKRIQLRRAYWLIEHSKRDYNGHRIKAMEHVKKAGEALGMDLHGEGYKGEHKQGTSDERMREAKDLLKEAIRETDSRTKEYTRLQDALREVIQALAVR